MGASSQSSCQRCPRGRWSDAIGANSASACTACGEGLYQPAVGQASQENCIACEPGSYNSGTGVARCTRCPKGTWSGSRGATSCNVCPDGAWTYIKGSLHADDCTRCLGANDCTPGATARLMVKIEGLDVAGLSESQLSALKQTYAAQIASTCNLPSSASVWDVTGENGTTSLAGGMIEAFVAVPPGSYANVLARALYAPAFKAVILQTTDDSPGVSPASAVGPVVLKLQRFRPQVMTSTLTTTRTFTSLTTTVAVAVTAGVTSETTPALPHYDLRGTTASAWKFESHANRGSSLMWCALLLASSLMATTVT